MGGARVSGAREELQEGRDGGRGGGSGWSRPGLAVIAFVGHVPGLKVIARCRFTPALVRVNVVAAGLTLIAMAVAWFAADEGQRGWAVLIAWLVGHFAWSTIFAGWILAGGAVRSD
jgi:hypothetical protein